MTLITELKYGRKMNDVRLKFTPGPWGIGVLGKDDGTPELDREKMAERFRESLMKGPEGNKCFFVTAMIDGESVTIGYTGNGPTSEANAQLVSYVPELVMRIDELEASLALSTKEVDRLQTNEVAIADERFDMERTLNARIAEFQQQVANLEEYMLKGVAFRDELQARIRELEEEHKKNHNDWIEALFNQSVKYESRLALLEEALRRARGLNGTECVATGSGQLPIQLEKRGSAIERCGRCLYCVIDSALAALKEGG